MAKEIFHEQLPYVRGRFEFEIIESRPSGKYRIHARDDAVGMADTEAEAIEVINELNRLRGSASPSSGDE